MSRARAVETLSKRRRMQRIPDEVLVPKRVRPGRKADIIQLQWYDGAGELQYEELSPAQSWPYLSRN